MSKLSKIAMNWQTPGFSESRDSVKSFSMLMEAVLRDNDHKGGWLECSPLWLLAKLNEEVGELGRAIAIEYHPSGRKLLDYPDTNGGHGMTNNLVRECVDIANVAMMLADVFAETAVSQEDPE